MTNEELFMNAHTDNRDKAEKVLMSYAESQLLQNIADEFNISKSKLLLLLFLKFVRERNEEQVLMESGLITRTKPGQ